MILLIPTTLAGYDSGSQQHRSACKADKAFEEEIGLRIAVFIVTVLVSAVLYDRSELTLFPARDSCRLVAFLSFALFVMFQPPHEIKKKARDNMCSSWFQRLAGRRGSKISSSTAPVRVAPTFQRAEPPQDSGGVPKNFLAVHKAEDRARAAYTKM